MSTNEKDTKNRAVKKPQDGNHEGDSQTGNTTTGVEHLSSNRQIRLLGAFYVVTAFLLFYLLFKAWPPSPWPTDEQGKNMAAVITFFARYESLKFDVHTSLDERLLFLVIVAGALGSYIHAATSFADYVGNRKMASSWLWWYILRPFIGVALALVFYFVVRAGFLTGGAGDVNPYGVATLGALAGMFSKQATDKLEEVFTTIFRPAPGKGDAKRGDKLVGPTVSGMLPREGPAAGGTEVVVSGNGFVDKPSVTFGGESATSVTFVNATTIKAVTPTHNPETVDVVVTNPDGQEGSPKERFTYLGEPGTGAATDVNTGAAAGETAVTGEGGDEDFIDGCDVEFKTDTADEDLPITEGGVE
ncbi:MAG: IPT/TIG domain-containing protein [Blastocatellia bacterium]|nr:IPT/TIG domain-containing protein [Blastocatellia bacterium]